MPRTIHCTRCGVALNIPDRGIGKRLKCPKCGTKFYAHDPGAAASSSAIGLHDATPASSQDVSNRHPDDFALPTAPGDLRETFDLPMMTEAASTPKKPGRDTSDAAALFKDDDRPAAPRRPKSAEARAKARRCPTCGGHVPIGMSLCSSCGLDLETGARIDLEDDLAPPPPPRQQGPPLDVVLIGGICLLSSIVLSCLSLVFSVQGVAGSVFFIPISFFGVFASIQFLRGKSTRLLLLALTLGALVDVFALIAMPIVYANLEVRTQDNKGSDAEIEGKAFQPVTERIDVNKLVVGIVLLVVYAIVSIYLVSAGANHHVRR